MTIAPAPSQDTRSDPATSARQFALDAARLLANTRCQNVTALDVRGLSPVTDFMIIATGTSVRQMQTACADVAELGEPRGFRTLSRSAENDQWNCIDMVDVVIHIFSQDARSYYDLDGLWGDARRVDWRDSAPPVSEPNSAPQT